MKMYTVIDLFAGAGGLSLGFTQTGAFKIVAAAENNVNAQRTYKANHKGTEILGDIRDIVFSDLRHKHGDVDVVIGGPPCQGFSNANRQKAQAISLNNSLVKHFVRAIAELKPPVFIMENVSMLRSETHRFYYSEEDIDVIFNLGIRRRNDNLSLLPAGLFEADLDYLINTLIHYERYLWNSDEYHLINMLFRQRNNDLKLKKTAKKYDTHIRVFAEKYIMQNSDNKVLDTANAKLATALTSFISDRIHENCLINCIEPALMLQRMYMHYKELIDNKIVIDGYMAHEGVSVQVSSFPVFEYVQAILSAKPYCYDIASGILNAVDFGAPQRRERYILIGTRNGVKAELPRPTFNVSSYRKVRDAISDLESVQTNSDIASEAIALPPLHVESGSLISCLRDSIKLFNHVIPETQDMAKKRFAALRPGDNFHCLDDELKSSYTDIKRTQNTIYLRLDYNRPSGTVVNVRKSMWVHPTLNRALSIREAARLQTFPDSFVFIGTKDSQYQQVGNAVPPMLSKAIAEQVLHLLSMD